MKQKKTQQTKTFHVVIRNDKEKLVHYTTTINSNAERKRMVGILRAAFGAGWYVHSRPGKALSPTINLKRPEKTTKAVKLG